MNKGLQLLVLGVAFTVVTACNGSSDVDPDKDPLDTSPAMGEMSCEQECGQLKKTLTTLNEQMVRDAGCEVGKREGALEDGQATGEIDGGTEYFCPNEKATNAFAEATANKSKKHSDALKNYNANCPCMVQLLPCLLCQNNAPGAPCLPQYMGRDECTQKGGTIQGE